MVQQRRRPSLARLFAGGSSNDLSCLLMAEASTDQPCLRLAGCVQLQTSSSITNCRGITPTGGRRRRQRSTRTDVRQSLSVVPGSGQTLPPCHAGLEKDAPKLLQKYSAMTRWSRRWPAHWPHPAKLGQGWSAFATDESALCNKCFGVDVSSNLGLLSERLSRGRRG